MSSNLGEKEEVEAAIQRACRVVRRAILQNDLAHPPNGRCVVIASDRIEERFAFSEHAIKLGWAVELRNATEEALAAPIGPLAVLVVVRSAGGVLTLCEHVRAQGYSRAICCLGGTGSADEIERASRVGVALVPEELEADGLLREFSKLLETSAQKYPAYLRCGIFEIDLVLARVWVLENGRRVEKDVPIRLFAALALMVQRNGTGAHIDELCEVSGTSRYDSAPRKLVDRMRKALGSVGGSHIKGRDSRYFVVLPR